MTGVYVAVVGPSGAGKDSVIEYARNHFADSGEVIFPRRVVTRPSGPGEDHVPTTPEGFRETDAAGGFAVTWQAHGLHYGIPSEVALRVQGGVVAVVNTSRGALASLPQRFAGVRAVRVTVSEEARRQRIAARGREAEAAAAARVARSDPAPDHPVDLEIVNDGTIAEAGAHLVGFLERVLVERLR